MNRDSSNLFDMSSLMEHCGRCLLVRKKPKTDAVEMPKTSAIRELNMWMLWVVGCWAVNGHTLVGYFLWLVTNRCAVSRRDEFGDDPRNWRRGGVYTMCPRCYVGKFNHFVPKKNGAKKAVSSGKRLASPDRNEENPFFQTPMHGIKLIIQYCSNAEIRSFILTCHKMAKLIDSENFWKMLCDWKGDELDVFFLMPGVECPEYWKDLFKIQTRKRKWIANAQKNGLHFVKYSQTYRTLNNPQFGAARIFSQNDVYLIRSFGTFVFKYSDIENVKLHAYARAYHSLRSGAIAEQLLYSDKFAEASTVCEVVCVVISNVNHRTTSFCDIAEAIFDLRLLSFVESECLSLEAMVFAPHQQEMPFEAYFLSIV